MISVVCVYNNKEILEEFLLKSLKKQPVEYELFLMDNRKGKFKSAAEALNKGAEKAKGKYIMFVHQDIDLLSDSWLENTENILDSLDNLGIAGVAGNIEETGTVITNITHGEPPLNAGKFQIQNPKKVQTLDECLIIIPKVLFEKNPFDKKTCFGWHSYAIDHSLSVKKQELEAYVIPLSLHHRSTGLPIDEEYYKSLENVRKKHKDYKRIYTTTGEWSTYYPINVQRNPFFKNKLKKILKKIRIF